jgi:hypothetical protein
MEIVLKFHVLILQAALCILKTVMRMTCAPQFKDASMIHHFVEAKEELKACALTMCAVNVVAAQHQPE